MKDEQNLNYGKLYFIEAKIPDDNKNFFGPLIEINSYSNYIKQFQLIKGKAMGITSNNELILWQLEQKKSSEITSLEKENKEQNNSSKNNFLLKNPIFIYNKIKMKNISINKTMCLSLDMNGNVLVWGENKNGLLGLGYDIISVKTPIIIEELKDIVEISLSENHAVALNSSGGAFSWGLGKYGELGLERSIYNPFPQQISTDNLYSKVFCGNFITCFLDYESHFSYFGVIIRNLVGNNSTITIKNLLNDESNYDGRTLVSEKIIEELEKEKIISIVIGNGFVGLLSNSGNIYSLEFNDKLTKLYSKYYCYNITVINNNIYGLSKNYNIYNTNKNGNNSLDKKNNKMNYFMCKWSSKYSSKNSICSEAWTTKIWKIKDDDCNINSNYKLININNNYKNNFIFLLDIYINEKKEDKANSEKKVEFKIYFEFESEFNDLYNLKYKRVKSKNLSLNNELSINGINKSRSLSRYLNKTYGSYNNFLNKHNPYTIGIYNLKNKNNSALRRINKSNTMFIKVNKPYKFNLDKNNNDTNNENEYFNFYDDSLELKEKELMNYRDEINNIIKDFKSKKSTKNMNVEIDGEVKKNNKLINQNEDNNNQGIIIKNNIPYSGRYYKNSLISKIANSRENIDNISLNKNNVNNNNIYNYNQKEIDSNIEEFFGKESSNIIKNDIYSDINESDNTNLNYLSPNIDTSNKRYIFNNNSNNLMVNSDRNKNIINNDTLNFSGGNYSNKKINDDKKINQHDFFDNNGELSPCFSKVQESLDLINSISSGGIVNIDKSNNDFFSDKGNKQNKINNNIIEINIDKNKLYQISESDKPRKKKNKNKSLNIDIQNSNYKSSFEVNSKNNKLSTNRQDKQCNSNNEIVSNIKKDKQIVNVNSKSSLDEDKNIKYLYNQFEENTYDIFKDEKISNIYLSNKKQIKTKIKKDNKLHKNYSSRNLLFSKNKSLDLYIRNNNKNNKLETNNCNEKKCELKELLLNSKEEIKLYSKERNKSKETKEKIENNNKKDENIKDINSNNIYLNPEDSFGNGDYISNEARRTGKFNKLSDDIDINNNKHNNQIENNPINNNLNKNSSKKNIHKIKSLNYKNNSNNNNFQISNNNKSRIFNNNFEYQVQINKDNNIKKKKLIQIQINKNSLINHYLKKKSYTMCMNEIANYQKALEKRYATKMIYRMMKKRIIFYQIKFLRRIKKIHRFLIKYEERLNMLKKNNKK